MGGSLCNRAQADRDETSEKKEVNKNIFAIPKLDHYLITSDTMGYTLLA